MPSPELYSFPAAEENFRGFPESLKSEIEVSIREMPLSEPDKDQLREKIEDLSKNKDFVTGVRAELEIIERRYSQERNDGEKTTAYAHIVKSIITEAQNKSATTKTS